MSTLSAAIKASGSALSAERARIEVAVSNLANAGSVAARQRFQSPALDHHLGCRQIGQERTRRRLS